MGAIYTFDCDKRGGGCGTSDSVKIFDGEGRERPFGFCLVCGHGWTLPTRQHVDGLSPDETGDDDMELMKKHQFHRIGFEERDHADGDVKPADAPQKAELPKPVVPPQTVAQQPVVPPAAVVSPVADQPKPVNPDMSVLPPFPMPEVKPVQAEPKKPDISDMIDQTHVKLLHTPDASTVRPPFPQAAGTLEAPDSSDKTSVSDVLSEVTDINNLMTDAVNRLSKIAADVYTRSVPLPVNAVHVAGENPFRASGIFKTEAVFFDMLTKGRWVPLVEIAAASDGASDSTLKTKLRHLSGLSRYTLHHHEESDCYVMTYETTPQS